MILQHLPHQGSPPPVVPTFTGSSPSSFESSNPGKSFSDYMEASEAEASETSTRPEGTTEARLERSDKVKDTKSTDVTPESKVENSDSKPSKKLREAKVPQASTVQPNDRQEKVQDPKKIAESIPPDNPPVFTEIPGKKKETKIPLAQADTNPQERPRALNTAGKTSNVVDGDGSEAVPAIPEGISVQVLQREPKAEKPRTAGVQVKLETIKEKPLIQVQVIDLRTMEGKVKNRKGAEHRNFNLVNEPDPRKALHITRSQRVEAEMPNISTKIEPDLVVNPGVEEVDSETLGQQKFQQAESTLGRLSEQAPRTNPWANVIHRIFGRDLEAPEQARTEHRESRILETQQVGDVSQRLTAQKIDSVVFGNGVDQGKLIDHLRNAGAFEIVRSAKFLLKDNDRGEIKLILKPEKLGEVKIHLTLVDNSIGAQILVDNKEVEDAFAQTLEDLKAAFRAQGFDTSEFSVEVRNARLTPEVQARGYDFQEGEQIRIDFAV